MYLHKCVGVYCIHESFQFTVYSLDSKTLYSITLVHLIPSWLVCSETECTVHVALPKWPMNQFKPVQQSIQQALRADCPNICTYILFSNSRLQLDRLVCNIYIHL